VVNNLPADIEREGIMRSMILRTAALATFLSTLFLPAYLAAQTVSAHVHGVTPLNCTPANSEYAGGRIILETPATVENGGPIESGPIPLNTGNAAFDPETGGGNHGYPGCP
jgi:hypothetical protein